VAILKPEHLFAQADRLIATRAGRPRQADIRRAISAAYYGIFHAILTAAADQFVGVTNRDRSQYGLVYRSVSHQWLRDLCREVQKPTLPTKLQHYAPSNGFGPNIVAFGAAVLELQQKRHDADYNVMIRMNRSDATLAITMARAALTRFKKASALGEWHFLFSCCFSHAHRSRAGEHPMTTSKVDDLRQPRSSIQATFGCLLGRMCGRLVLADASADLTN
jgi:hypothetical protein